MQTVLIVIHIIIVIALVGIILLQRSGADSLSGLGGGSAGGSALMSGRATANVLTKTTAILATLFMLNSLVMAIMVSRSSKAPTVVDSIIEEQKNGDVQPLEDTTPVVPLVD